MSAPRIVTPPFIPDKVDPDEDFLSQRERNFFKDPKQTFLRTPNQEVIRAGNDLYVIPQDEAYFLGEGGFGKVRLAKNTETGEWIAVKIVKQGKMDEKEIEHLQKFNELRFDINNGDERYIGMKLKPGKDLFNVIEEQRSQSTLSPFQLLDIFITLLGHLDTIHIAMLLHCDIKPENVIYDPLTDTASLTDYGLMSVGGEDKKMTQGTWKGTTYYRPPEHKKDQKQFEFNVKTDMYAMALTLAELAGFAITNGKKQGGGNERLVLAEKSQEYFFRNKQFSDPGVREAVYDYLKKMLHERPDLRPTAAEAKTFFRGIQAEYLPTLAMIKKVVYLDLNIYLHASDDKQKEMIKNLKNEKADEVLLLDSSENDLRTDKLNLTISDYAKIQHRLRKAGLPVAPNVIAGLKPAELSEAVNHYYQKLEKENNNIYVIKGMTPNAELTTGPIKVSINHLNKIIKNLQQEWERVHAKSDDKYASKTSKINYNKRKDNIEKAVIVLQNKYAKGELTYDALKGDLENLQKKLLSQSRLQNWVRYKTKSQEKVKHIIDEVNTIRRFKK